MGIPTAEGKSPTLDSGRPFLFEAAFRSSLAALAGHYRVVGRMCPGSASNVSPNRRKPVSKHLRRVAEVPWIFPSMSHGTGLKLCLNDSSVDSGTRSSTVTRAILVAGR